MLLRTALLLILSLPALAGRPIATVSSPEPFTVDGRSTAQSDANSVPLAVGDEVATSTAPAVLFFFDGSSVKLAAGSRAKLTGSDSQPKLVLLAGSLDYKVVLGSNLSVTSLDLERKMTPGTRTTKPAAAMKAPASAAPRGDEATLTANTR